MDLHLYLQHTRYDEFGTKTVIKVVEGGKQLNCRVCDEIMETDRVGKECEMCIYNKFINGLNCSECDLCIVLFWLPQSYIGETVDLLHRTSSHRSNALSENRDGGQPTSIWFWERL